MNKWTIDPNRIRLSYKEIWNRIKDESHSTSLTAQNIHQQITDLVDELITCLVNKHGAFSEGLSFLALGGYARKQMAPQSDIDLLILHQGELSDKQKDFLSLFTADIWDIGTNPGIQIKEIGEVATAAMEDDVVRTSFIDNRFLTGEQRIYELFCTVMNETLAEKGVNAFLLSKIQSVRKRSSKFRDSIYRLEPNIKEGSGGIRDINTINWICKILYKTDSLSALIKNNMLMPEELTSLEHAAEFLFRIRIELHYYHNRKNDIMNLEAQKHLAEFFGYNSTSTVLSVENFMRDYYKNARTIAEITERVINRTMAELTLKMLHRKSVKVSDIGDGFIKYGNQLSIKSKDIFVEKPKRLITVFNYASVQGLKISDTTYDAVRASLYLIDSKFLRQYGELFLKTISRFPDSSEICSRMGKAGVLQAMIPEFEEIDCKPQFDYYHHYTVDEHTFLALGYIDRLLLDSIPQHAVYLKVLNSLERKDLLALSIILHDIGKGQGKNHSQVGAKMSKIICGRLGMNMDDSDIVSNLVLHHLLMSNIAQRRDIHDVEVIKYFLNFINSAEELKLLFLLTYADMNAVGGKVFNEWRHSLLCELYNKAIGALDTEHLEQEHEKVINRKREKLLERTASNPELNELAQMLDEDMLLSNSVGHILRMLELAVQVTDNHDVMIETELKEETDSIEISVCTQDFAGVLRLMTGALSSLGLNILWAQINTLPNNVTIDKLIVQNPWDDKETFDEKCAIMVKRVREAVLGNFDIERALESKQAMDRRHYADTHKKDKVVFDNEISGQYTILDIFADDRLGLLYNILGIFKKLGLNLIKAKISTDVDKAVDSFYLTDLNGAKITDEQKLESIRRELILELGRPNF